MLLLLITVAFACITFISEPLQENIFNPIFSYYFTEARFILGNFVFFFLGFIVLPLIFIQSNNFKSYPIHRKYILSLAHVAKISVLGFFLSAVLIFTVAIIEINVFTIFMNVNPNLAGIQSDIKFIESELASMKDPPHVIPATHDKKKIPIAISIASTGTDNFFGKNILSSIPGVFILPINEENSDVFLVNNFLIITNINDKNLQTVSPHVGYLMVQKYFPQKNIRHFPKITIMAKQDYLNYRKIDADKKISILNQAVEEIEDNISSYSAGIQSNKDRVIENSDIINEVLSQKDSQYKICIASKIQTVRCQELRVQSENTIISLKNELAVLNKLIEYGQYQLAEYQYYQSIFEYQKEILKLSEKNILYERGMFEPKDSIKIVIDKTSPSVVSDYINTLIHEYLHYASFVSDNKRLESSFFEEGLTEYFARQAMISSSSEVTSLSYSAQVKIISEMTNKISESELAEIYFSKSDSMLETTLNRIYGDLFYKNNLLLFEALQITPDSKQILKLANDIMGRIGGLPLTEKDLMNTSSKTGI